LHAGKWSLRAGGDYSSVEQSAVRYVYRRDNGFLLFEDRVWPDAEIDALGIYLQATHPVARGLVSATVRLDANDATAKNATEFFLANTQGSLDQSDEDVSVAISGLWRLRDDLIVTAGAGRVVRYPTTLERYSDRFPSTRFQIAAEFMGDPSLAPETALQLDVGIARHGARSLFELDLYHRTIDDYITVRLDPSLPRRLPLSPTTVYRYTNGDGAEFIGAEVNWRISLTDTLQASLGASYLRGEDLTFDEPAFGVPPLQTTAGVRWAPLQPLFVEAVLTVTDSQDRVATSRNERATPGSEVVDLLAGWQFTHVELRGGIRNLFDEDYADHLNSLDPFGGQRLSEPGRSVFVGLEFSL
ncbi:MAG: TonB-dependent receptor, partial [Thermoanaerobaculia bacterium]|nr:TonB-dependent receptor [Thermoanaerobaculia bacterium]